MDGEYGNWAAKDAEAKQQRAKKDTARAAWEAKGRPLVRRIKAHPGYTRHTESPYVDNRPLLVAGKPEMRKYRATYVVNDAEVGQASDEVTVTVTP